MHRKLDIVIFKDRTSAEVVGICHHQATREQSDAPFKHTHVYVQHKGLYIFAPKQCGRECDNRRVGGSQNFFHARKLGPEGKRVETANEGKVTMSGNTGPFERMQNVLADDMNAVNTLIRTRMASEHAPRIPEVTAHLVEAGGKRLRPMLTLAAARMCGYEGEDHVKLAATVEFIHTATLLHDDVVDESGKRRGKPTANLLWDNKSSILVGDYLFARSFQLMVETGRLKVLDILANASAVIAEGEVLQLTAAQNLATTEEIYLQVVRGKTAALFAAACEVGGEVADAPQDQIDALHAYGDALGISFQIVDDLLDYGGASASLGKNTGDDFRERKLTMPVILAIAKAETMERAFWVRTIEKGKQEDGDLEHAMKLMAKYGTLEETRLKALDWANTAKAALAPIPESELRSLLEELADFVVSRIV